MRSVNPEVAVYLRIAGKVDFTVEIARQHSGVEEVRAKLQKIQDVLETDGWDKASEETRRKEQDKLKDAESEISRKAAALEELKRLALH